MTRTDPHRCPRCAERDRENMRLRSALLAIEEEIAPLDPFWKYTRGLRGRLGLLIKAGLAKPNSRRRRTT